MRGDCYTKVYRFSFVAQICGMFKVSGSLDKISHEFIILASEQFSLAPHLGGNHEDWHKSRPLVVTYVRPGGPADRYHSEFTHAASETHSFMQTDLH